jgi:hypothetical protein
MDRLSDWRAAAWVAFCLAGFAVAAALIVPAALRHHRAPTPKPELRATISPRTHLFGQAVTATVEAPAGFTIKPSFAPYSVLSHTTIRTGRTTTYRFTLDCLRSSCVGAPGAEQEIDLPPVRIVLPNGTKLVGLWSPLRQASRLGPGDLEQPALRGDLIAPSQPSPARNHLGGILAAVAGGLALLGAGILGFRWLGWRPSVFWSENGRRELSSLEYALVVTGLAAGGGRENRRAALESLAIALEERGLGELAAEARSIAWSPQPPAGEALHKLATEAQNAARTAK